MRAALYPRVSTEEQHLHGLSLSAQRQALIDYANANGYDIVGIYADEGISARKPVSKRPALLRLLADVEKDRIDIILVTKLDRWFRNIKEYHITQEILEKHNCYWKTIFESYDTSTANGQMVVNIMLSVAQSESDRTSERIKDVFRHKREQGMVPTGKSNPYGYRIVNKRLEKDPDTQHIVEDAIDYYFSWFSIQRVYKYLQEKYGENAPSFNQVDRIFKNSKYWGEWDGRSDYCEPYMTKEQARKVADVKNSRTHESDGYNYIFSGLLICPHCKTKMTGHRVTKHLKNGSVSVYRRYRCNQKYNVHSAPDITEKIVEQYLVENVIQKLDEEIFRAEQRVKKQKKSPVPSLMAERDRLNSMYLKGRISEEYYDEQYAVLTEKINRYENLIIITPESYKNIQPYFAGDWKDIYYSLDNLHKQAFWKSIIKEIHIDPQTHRLCDFIFLV